MPFIKADNAKTVRILQDALGPDTQGIIWITVDSLVKHPYPFEALDYFFEGVLGKSLKSFGQNLSEDKSIFFSECFGHPFFLTWVSQNKSSNKKIFKEVFDVVEGIRKGRDKILVLEGNTSSCIERLKVIYPSFQFVSLRLGY